VQNIECGDGLLFPFVFILVIIFGSYIQPSVYGFQVWEDFLLDLFVQCSFGVQPRCGLYLALASLLSFIIFSFHV